MAEKEIVRTERAPAPFEGAPYNQAVKVRRPRLRRRPARPRLDGTGMVGGGVAEQTEQAMQNLSAILAGSGEQSGATRQDDRLPAEPRRLRGHERGVRDTRRRTRRRPGRPWRWRSSRPAPSSRSRRSPTSDQNVPVRDSVADYVHSLGPRRLRRRRRGARQAARDPREGSRLRRPGRGPRRAAGRTRAARRGRRPRSSATSAVGVRLLPRDRAAPRAQPAGIEFAPPRVERSTGPGRHDFEIVADAGISLEQDMERRDFTINRDRATARDRVRCSIHWRPG